MKKNTTKAAASGKRSRGAARKAAPIETQVHESKAPASVISITPASLQTGDEEFANLSTAEVIGKLDSYTERVTALEKQLTTVRAEAARLYNHFQDKMYGMANSMRLTVRAESQPGPVPDRDRDSYRPKKNLTLAVRATFRWAKEKGSSYEDAKQQVLARVHKKMRDYPELHGKLPEEVAELIETTNYDAIPVKRNLQQTAGAPA